MLSCCHSPSLLAVMDMTDIPLFHHHFSDDAMLCRPHVCHVHVDMFRKCMVRAVPSLTHGSAHKRKRFHWFSDFPGSKTRSTFSCTAHTPGPLCRRPSPRAAAPTRSRPDRRVHQPPLVGAAPPPRSRPRARARLRGVWRRGGARCRAAAARRRSASPPRPAPSSHAVTARVTHRATRPGPHHPPPPPPPAPVYPLPPPP